MLDVRHGRVVAEQVPVTLEWNINYFRQMPQDEPGHRPPKKYESNSTKLTCRNHGSHVRCYEVMTVATMTIRTGLSISAIMLTLILVVLRTSFPPYGMQFLPSIYFPARLLCAWYCSGSASPMERTQRPKWKI